MFLSHQLPFFSSEYLATFKKTVAMHEMFLSRLAQHPVFRYDTNFRVFLEYDQDLAVRTKNKKELFEVNILVFKLILIRFYISYMPFVLRK